MNPFSRENLHRQKENGKLYIRTLFDFSFTNYLTIQMLPFFYGIMVAACGSVVAYAVVEGFAFSFWRGLFYLMVSPFAFLVLLSVARALFEFYIVVFRIAENVDEMVQLKDHVERLSGITDDMSNITRRIPFWGLITRSPRNSDSSNKPDAPGKADTSKS